MPHHLPGRLDLDQIETKARALNAVAGGWPVRFKSERDKASVIAEWYELLKQALQCYEEDLAREEQALWVVAELCRQGHNMELENCGQNAHQALRVLPVQVP